MKRSILIALVAVLVVTGVVAACKFTPRELSYSECSSVYRHFADMQLEGVRVTYVRDKVVNDTLRLPVTLLEAETDRGWELLDSLFGYSETLNEIMSDPDMSDSLKRQILKDFSYCHFYRSHRETPEKRIESKSAREDDLMVYVLGNRRLVSIFETGNGVAYDSKQKKLEAGKAHRRKNKAVIKQMVEETYHFNDE